MDNIETENKNVESSTKGWTTLSRKADATIQYRPTDGKETVRKGLTKLILNDTVKGLKEKPVFCINAIKENAIGIMAKEEYGETVMDKLNNDNSHELRKNPLPESIQRGKNN